MPVAFTVAVEHTSASINGVPRQYELRVTTIFRREEGTWKVVHRHADPVASVGSATVREELLSAP